MTGMRGLAVPGLVWLPFVAVAREDARRSIEFFRKHLAP